MNSEAAAALLRRGHVLFDAKPARVAFTRHADADALLNDLRGHPHAFVLACIMNRQIRAERAWMVPHLISQKLGDFSFSRLHALNLDDVRALLAEPEPLHRFPEEMSRSLHSAIEHIAHAYAGDAGCIWRNEPPSAAVVLRFLKFRGIGPKIATMAANILARDFKIPLSDHYSIDVSADAHVRRVCGRLGLVDEAASVAEIIYWARAHSPAFPGLLDLPVWEIGRTWCRPTSPSCAECSMHALCPTAASSAAGAADEGVSAR